MKQNLHAIADTKYNHFQKHFYGLDRFTSRTKHAADNHFIWILLTKPGVNYIASELWQQKLIKKKQKRENTQKEENAVNISDMKINVGYR